MNSQNEIGICTADSIREINKKRSGSEICRFFLFDFMRSYLVRLRHTMKKVEFVEDEIYHICSRGVDKRTIFLDDKDRFRFIHDLYEFNDEELATNLYYKKPHLQSYEIRSHKIKYERKTIVEILAFVLMPNHYHLLLKQLGDGSISEFMRRLGIGYAMYFNQKYQRTGTLFEGRFRRVLVEKEAHFIHLPFYIHANPLDLKFPEWREKKIRNYKMAMSFLENYRWSSFPDYIGKKNFPSVTQREFLTECIGKPKAYKITTLTLLKEMDLGTIQKVALESL